MSQSRYIAIAFLLAFVCCESIGQNISFKSIPPQYDLTPVKLNAREDLGLFNDIVEDDEGYVWLSSANGLHVFDGSSTVTYTGGKGRYGFDIDTTPRSFVFLSDAGNHKILAQQTGNRFLRFNTQQREIEKMLDKGTDKKIQFLSGSENAKGELLIFSYSFKEKKIILQKAGKNNELQTIFQTKVPNPRELLVHKMGNEFWLWNDNRFMRLNREGVPIKTYPNKVKISSNASIYSNDSSFYYLDKFTYTIFRWNKEKDTLEPYLKIPTTVKPNLTGLYIKGQKVFIADNLYLYILDMDQKTLQDLSRAFVEAIKKEAHGGLGVNFLKFTEKKDGTLWVSNLKTVLKISEKLPAITQFKEILDDDGLSSNTISFRALAEDEEKNTYASYYGGIAIKKKDKPGFEAVQKWRYLINESKGTYSLNHWNGHLIWNNVVIRLKDDATYFIGPPYNAGHCNQWVQNDTVWIYIWHTRELYKYELQSHKQTAIELKNKTNNEASYYAAINDMSIDAGGVNFWVSSTYNGIQLISKKGELLKWFDNKKLSTADNDIQEIEVDGNVLWFGCAEGLGRLDTKTGKTVIYKNPLITGDNVMQNRAVFSIFSDEKHNLYLGSSYGLLYFNTQTLQFYNLPNAHPLAAIEFNKMSTIHTSEGRYYFGSTDGLFSFFPNELHFEKASNQTGPLKLIGTAVFDQQEGRYKYEHRHLQTTRELMLEASESNVELQFSVPEFSNKVYYSYRIKEHSNQWTAPKLDNKIFLYGLQPGTHTLEVRASTGIAENEASLYTITINKKQVWYKKTWVILLFLLTMVSLVFLLLRYRFNQKLERQKALATLRTKISADLHDEVGTLLSGLAMQSQILAIETTEDKKEALNNISQMGREAMERMRDTVWAIDSRKDKVENLIDRMRDYAEKNLHLKKMTHEFVNQVGDTKKFIDPEKRQNIYLIFKEAITNIMKHSDGSHVTIIVSEERGKLKLIVKDNGREKPASRSDGQGLSNMVMRAKKTGGSLSTRYEGGFCVELVI